MDGNVSIHSSYSEDLSLPDPEESILSSLWKTSSLPGSKSSSSSQPICTIIGNRPNTSKIPAWRPPTLTRIRRDNKGELSLFLPSIAVYNHRSLWKKAKSLCTELEELNIGLALHSEVWEKKEKKAHKKKIEEMVQIYGLTYISTPRPGRRGGGSAITCNDNNFYLKEINVENPSNLEVTFATLRPKSKFAPKFMIIVCSVYSPPRSRKKTILIDFIAENYNCLKTKYPSAFFLLGGDINCLKTDQLLTISPAFRQIVTKPTRQGKILSVIITDLHSHYQEPVILPPLKTDILGVGKPSDHSAPYTQPYTDTSRPRRKTFSFKIIRPLPDSGKQNFGKWITEETFEEMKTVEGPTNKVYELEKIMNENVERIFPTKEVKLYDDDKEWMTEELRKLRRQKSREYSRHQKSTKWLEMQRKFVDLKAVNTKKYMENEIEELKTSNPSQFYRRIKNIGSRLGECPPSTFSIPTHVEENLSPTEISIQIASHFSSISQEYPPLDIATLPPRVRQKLLDPNVMEKAPVIQPWEVYEKFRKRKFKHSSVPNDIPPRLKREFGPEIASPAADIFNSINRTGTYPRQWVREWVSAIPKVSPPETLDDLRNINLISDLSKDYENFLLDWIMPYIKDRMDPGQFGATKGCSITHYLITLYHFILSSIDRSDSIPHAVMVALVDFKKGFNRLNHNKIIIRLSDWGVPGWLLKILSSYLTERSMILRHAGVQTEPHLLPGGGPQGALMGILCFLVEVSDAGMDPPPRLPVPHHPGDVSSVPYPPPPSVTEDEARLKYIDDLSMAESIRLDTNLCSSSTLIGPRIYHDRNGLTLQPANSILQRRLNDLVEYVEDHDMVLNTKKTKIIPFNFTRKYDFVPEYKLNHEVLEVVYQTKLLGVVCTSDCKWVQNTKYIVGKASSKLWFLRRLKTFGASVEALVDVYKLFVRSNLEFAVPLWAGAIKKREVRNIERVQRSALAIIFGSNYSSYEDRLDKLGLETLSDRRMELCKKFGTKMSADSRFSSLFPKGVSTRSGRTLIVAPTCNTQRFAQSAIPFLIHILNSN